MNGGDLGKRPRVVVICSGAVPGQGLPATVSGLRAYGLAEGLQAHGFLVTVLAVGVGVRPHKGVAAAGVETIKPGALAGRVASARPAAVVAIDPLQLPQLPRTDGVTRVLDFCGPGLLGLAGSGGDDAWARERSRLIEAIGSADGLIVSGALKVPHYLAWAFQTGRNVLKMPIRLVEFCLPAAAREHREGQGSLRLVIFVDADKGLPVAAEVLLGHLDQGMTIVLVPSLRRGGAAGGLTGVEELSAHRGVKVLPPLPFEELRGVLAESDVAVDVQAHGLAAQYSAAADAAVAVTSGLPVAYSPFGEMAPAIAEYDAGWLLDDAGALDDLAVLLRADPVSARSKAEGATRLAGSRLDPATAVRPLVEIIEKAV